MIDYRKATISDTAAIIKFVDFWLSGRGLSSNLPGVVNDYFVSHKQHIDYLRRYFVLLALDGDRIVGWAVRSQANVMLHLLVAGDYRQRGIGTKMIQILRPEVIRSKVDQSTGDPAKFYEKQGYEKLAGERLGKRKNIELFVRPQATS